MSYEEIVKDTAEMTRRMQLKWDIISAVLVLMMAALIVMAVRIMWEDHKERKARKAAWGQYRPTVTDTVQYDEYGNEYHLMGAAGRR